MMKIIKEVGYKEVLVCENCGAHWSTDVNYLQYSAGICKCYVCKKEGCDKCATWVGLAGEKYHYHLKCEKGLPKKVLKANKKYEDEYDRRQAWSDYRNRGY